MSRGRKSEFPELGPLSPAQRKQRERGEPIRLTKVQAAFLAAKGKLHTYLSKGFLPPELGKVRPGPKPKPDTVRSVPWQQETPLEAGPEEESPRARSERLNPDLGTELVKAGDDRLPARATSMSLHLHGGEQAQQEFLEELERVAAERGPSLSNVWRVGEKVGETEYIVTKVFDDGHRETFTYDPVTKKLTPTAERSLKKGYTFRE